MKKKQLLIFCEVVVDTKVFPPHFDDHAFPVHGLQQSRSEDPVHFNGAANDLLRQFLDFFKIGSHVRTRSTKHAGTFSRFFAQESPEVSSICTGAGPQTVEKLPGSQKVRRPGDFHE